MVHVTYGSVGQGGRGRTGPSASRALVVGLVAAGCLAVASIVLAAGGVGSRRVVLTDLDSSIPSAVQDMFTHVDIAAKKDWMRNIAQLANGEKQLHPLADIDPFTNTPGDGTSHEAILRHKETKNIVEQVQDSADEEMSAAQEMARTAVGADAGCTHRLENQIDYAGTIGVTALGAPCMSWQTAFDTGVDTTYNPADFSELGGSACRNPGGSKLGAWCYVDTTASPSVSGADTWDYCNVGKRCAVDMPILHQAPPKGGATEARARDGASKAGMPVFTGEQARKAVASSSWLKLDKDAARIDPKITSYISAKAARKQLVDEGLA